MLNHVRGNSCVAALCCVLLLSACGGGGGGNDDPPQGPAGTLQFEGASFQVEEGVGALQLTVTRTAGSAGAVSVTISSTNGSASAGEDFTAVATTVSFAAGDASAKTIALQINDDAAAEMEEGFAIAMSAPTGGASLGASTSVAVTVRDNDALVLSLAAGLKQLTFNWPRVPGATVYRLLSNADGASGFAQIGTDLAADANILSVAVSVHRHDWVNALYRLEACNAAGCIGSPAISAAPVMLESIGYFKSSHPQELDAFGWAVAISGDGNYLAVGAPFEDSKAHGINGDQNNDLALNSGAVYLFRRDAAGQWGQQIYLKASNTHEGDRFGTALALNDDGTTLAVGAWMEDSSATGINGDESALGVPDSGAVYVFTRSGDQWRQQAYVKASNTDRLDGFGNVVALSADGNTLAVGALTEDGPVNTRVDAGAAYVFQRTAGTWQQQALLYASNAEADDRFGSSIALAGDGNTLAVGAAREDSGATGIDGIQGDNAETEAGAVYVYARVADVWIQQAYVKASNTDSQDQFGTGVSLDDLGKTLLVGAYEEDSAATGVGGAENDESMANSGAVYVFAYNGVQWTQQAYVKASNPGMDERFGQVVQLARDGQSFAVGALGEDSNAIGIGGDQFNTSLVNAGAAYVFVRDQQSWRQSSYVKASNSQAENWFSHSLALSRDGSTLAVCAALEESGASGIGGNQNDNSAMGAGALYLY